MTNNPKTTDSTLLGVAIVLVIIMLSTPIVVNHVLRDTNRTQPIQGN